jgi:hypothetical protein
MHGGDQVSFNIYAAKWTPPENQGPVVQYISSITAKPGLNMTLLHTLLHMALRNYILG